jgi:multidrug efflux system membrane fusion protein
MPDTRSGKIGPDHQLTYRKKSPLKLVISIVLVALIAIAIGWLLTHQSKPAGPGAPGGRRGAGGFGGRNAITVGTASASIGNIPIQIDALGTVTPPITATVASRIAGNLMAVYFTEGQMVKKGQKLALIDPRPYQVALEQAQGTLARDQAALADAQLDLQRYQTLAKQNSIAQQTVDTQAALVKQDAGVVQTDKAAVDSAKLNLTYTLITAPAAGRVGLRQVDIGNYIPVGSTTGLVVLTQVDPIDVVFTIPEDNVPQITKRQRMGASLPVTVFDRGGGVTLAQGKLSTLDNQIDTSTGTVKAKARFDNGSGALFPNQFVNTRMLVDVLCNAVIVPTTAVRHGSQGDFVYTLQPDRTVKMVIVKTGAGTAENVSILSGLKGSETVITEGGDRLRDGAKVTLPGDRPAGGGVSGARRRGQGRPGGGQGFGGQGPGAAGPAGGFGPGAGGGASGGRRFGGRRGGGQDAQGAVQDVNQQIASSDVTGVANATLPDMQIPPGACSAGGQRGGYGSKGGAGRGRMGQGAPGGQGQPGQAVAGPAVPDGRRFGPGGPQGPGGFHRRGGSGQPGGQTQGQDQG